MASGSPARFAPIESALSSARLGTYLAACAGDPGSALDLYAWNAQVSAALMVPAHFAEVCLRNAVSEALENVYGPRWPWNSTLELALPVRAGRYRQRDDLVAVRNAQPTTGKVVADLKFAFWQSMMTSRHDVRLWNSELQGILPNAPLQPVPQLRARVYDDLDHIRRLRNRLAHHEPVYGRDLKADVARMYDLMALRSAELCTWVASIDSTASLIASRP